MGGGGEGRSRGRQALSLFARRRNQQQQQQQDNGPSPLRILTGCFPRAGIEGTVTGARRRRALGLSQVSVSRLNPRSKGAVCLVQRGEAAGRKRRSSAAQQTDTQQGLPSARLRVLNQPVTRYKRVIPAHSLCLHVLDLNDVINEGRENTHIRNGTASVLSSPKNNVTPNSLRNVSVFNVRAYILKQTLLMM